MSEDEKLLKEAKKMAWEDRLAHKNWKVRNDANIDIAGVCDGIMDPKDPRLREFGNASAICCGFLCFPGCGREFLRGGAVISKFQK